MRAYGLLLALTVGLAATSASAQGADDGTRAAARALGNAGVEAFQAGDFQTANDKLGRAYDVLQAPSLGLWSARALVKVGKLVEAAQRYLDVTRLSISGGEASIQKQAQVDAQHELDALTPRIPSVVVRVEGADPAAIQVTLDGAPLPAALVGEARPVNPGAHAVVGTRGSERVEVSVTVAEREQGTALLKFGAIANATAPGPEPVAETVAPKAEPAPQSAPAPEPPMVGQSAARAHSTLPAWLLIGGGGAGLVVGAATGVAALSKKSSIDGNANCRDNHCLPSEKGTVDGYNTLRTVSTIGFVAGGVLAATGVVLLVVSRPHESSTATAQGSELSLRVGPGMLAVARSF